jgi:hypothetical protein
MAEGRSSGVRQRKGEAGPHGGLYSASLSTAPAAVTPAPSVRQGDTCTELVLVPYNVHGNEENDPYFQHWRSGFSYYRTLQ